MNYKESDEVCAGCGATAADRSSIMPNAPQGLSACPVCEAEKCCICDMGDDVDCANCPE